MITLKYKNFSKRTLLTIVLFSTLFTQITLAEASNCNGFLQTDYPTITTYFSSGLNRFLKDSDDLPATTKKIIYKSVYLLIAEDSLAKIKAILFSENFQGVDLRIKRESFYANIGKVSAYYIILNGTREMLDAFFGKVENQQITENKRLLVWAGFNKSSFFGKLLKSYARENKLKARKRRLPFILRAEKRDAHFSQTLGQTLADQFRQLLPNAAIRSSVSKYTDKAAAIRIILFGNKNYFQTALQHKSNRKSAPYQVLESGVYQGYPVQFEFRADSTAESTRITPSPDKTLKTAGEQLLLWRDLQNE